MQKVITSVYLHNILCLKNAESDNFCLSSQ
jgi:hypothetical protein